MKNMTAIMPAHCRSFKLDPKIISLPKLINQNPPLWKHVNYLYLSFLRHLENKDLFTRHY